MWMTDKRYFDVSIGDVAIRLDLIAKVHGIEEAEKYFNNIPMKLRGIEVYCALLNCYAYVHVKDVEKAEAVMQKIRDLGFDRTLLAFNVLLNLYYQTGNHEKLDALMHEMEEKGIKFDSFTYGIRLSAYAATSDVEGIDKVLQKMESNPESVLNWTIYAVAANGYKKAGIEEKALEMLKKAEGLVNSTRRSKAFEFLLTQYASIGKKDEVIRLWELYKKKEKIYNRGYISVLTSLLRLDDIESAEEIFEDWETRELTYDIRIPNFLIGYYCRKGLLEKAETLVNLVILKGEKPDAKSYNHLATGYILINQLEKAVEAMNEAISACRPRWKPRQENFAACLEYLKGKGDVEGAVEFLELLRNKEVISVDAHDRLLKYINDSESSSHALSVLEEGASVENGKTTEFLEPEEDSFNYKPSSSNFNTDSENF